MGEEDGGSDRPKVNNSATGPKVYAAWSLNEWRNEISAGGSLLLCKWGLARKGDFFRWPPKIKYPAVIYTTFLILRQSQTIAPKPSLLFGFFHETQQFFQVFEITKTSGSFILIFFQLPTTVVVWF